MSDKICRSYWNEQFRKLKILSILSKNSIRIISRDLWELSETSIGILDFSIKFFFEKHKKCSYFHNFSRITRNKLIYVCEECKTEHEARSNLRAKRAARDENVPAKRTDFFYFLSHSLKINNCFIHTYVVCFSFNGKNGSSFRICVLYFRKKYFIELFYEI